jgi:hypothetical protein
LPAGNALGYNQNWQYWHTGGELLMMGATGEPSEYYPMDSNGLAVQSEQESVAPRRTCIADETRLRSDRARDCDCRWSYAWRCAAADPSP